MVCSGFRMMSGTLTPSRIRIRASITPMKAGLTNRLSRPRTLVPSEGRTTAGEPPFAALLAEPASPTEPAPFTEPFATAPRAPIALPSVVSTTGSHSHTPYVQSSVWSMIDISAT